MNLEWLQNIQDSELPKTATNINNPEKKVQMMIYLAQIKLKKTQ